jgi:hypothetical protein
VKERKPAVLKDAAVQEQRIADLMLIVKMLKDNVEAHLLRKVVEGVLFEDATLQTSR